MLIEKIDIQNILIYEMLFPRLSDFIKINNNNLSNTSTCLFYCYQINLCGYINQIANIISHENELKKNYYKDSNHFFSSKSFFIIDCCDFYGKTLIEFISELVEHGSVLKKKNLIILHNYEELDRDTQNKLSSKMDIS